MDRISRYISERSEKNAPRFIEELVTAIDSLEFFPHRYNVVMPSRRRGRGVRMMVVWPYLVYFRVFDEDKVVRIVSVRHGARRRPRRLD